LTAGRNARDSGAAKIRGAKRISQQMNDSLTRVGPGSEAGAVLRRYWQPAALSDELMSARPVVPVTLLGGRSVLFRDSDGELGLIGRHCPHRAANPCFAIAAQILSGLAGIRAGMRAPEPTETPYDDAARALPATLAEAIGHFEGSALCRAALGDEFVDVLTRIKRAEWDRYLAEVSAWEQAEYFTLF